MRTSAILLLTALLISSAVAQQKSPANATDQSKTASAPALPAEAPSKEQLIRLFDAMEIQKQVQGVMNAMGANVEKMMPFNVDALTEKQKTAIAGLEAELFSKMMSPELIDSYVAQIIPIYQRHFTKSDVDGLISFYASPAGQKLLHEQPAITQESMTMVVPLMQKRVQDVLEETHYEQRIKQIFAESNDSAPPPKN